METGLPLGVLAFHGPGLHGPHGHARVTDDPRQRRLPKFGQLPGREGSRLAAVLVPVAVALLQVSEGPADDAREGGPHHGTRGDAHPLGDAGGPQIHVVGVPASERSSQ